MDRGVAELVMQLVEHGLASAGVQNDGRSATFVVPLFK
jgi:hypothetical protein